jgi:hypothetical protein
MHHEENLRLVAISLFASICGIAACFSLPIFRNSWHETLDLVFLLIAIPIIAIVSFIASIFSTALLHHVIRRRKMGRAFAFALFVAAGILEGVTMYRNPESPAIFLGAAVSFFSWLLYCFGPFKLWRFIHIPALHGDF